jgi:hypothetical protein
MSKKQYDNDLVDLLVEQYQGGERGSPALSWLREGGVALDALDLQTAHAAIEAASRLGLGDRLVQAREGARDKVVRKAAGAALHRMRAAGVVVEEERSGSTWSMVAEEVELPAPTALLGYPEADGYFPYVLLTWGREGACVSAGLAGAGQGFRGDEHGHLSRSGARRMLDEVRRDHALIEVPFHAGLHLVESAMDQGGGRRPHGWDHMMEKLDQAQKDAARLLDPLSRLPTELDRDALHHIDALMTGDRRVVMFVDEDLAHKGATECLTALASQVERDNLTRKQRIARVVDQTADAAMATVSRKNWHAALNVTAFLADTEGRSDLCLAARHNALALAQDLPGRDVPFVREWVDQQLVTLSELAQQHGLGEMLGLEGAGDEDGVIDVEAETDKD